MSKLIIIVALVNSISCLAQTAKIDNRLEGVEKWSYNDSLKTLQINCGENGVDQNYIIDSFYLKYSDLEELYIWVELDNKSDVYIDEGLLVQFKDLWNIEIVRHNDGKLFFPNDLVSCTSLTRIYIDLGTSKGNFLRLPKEIKGLTSLEYFELILPQRCGNRKLIHDIGEFIMQSNNLKHVRVIYGNKKFNKLAKLCSNKGVKFN